MYLNFKYWIFVQGIIRRSEINVKLINLGNQQFYIDVINIILSKLKCCKGINVS